MMSLAPEVSTVLTPLQSLFTALTWRKGQVLLMGTLLARGRRSVTAALQQMGVSVAPDFSLYLHVLNRARWSALEGNRRLLHVLVRRRGPPARGPCPS
jgi:hypothetical protein